MHKIFITDAIVLGKRFSGEATTTLALLTRDLGLLRASARSARVEKSKLRYGLQVLTKGRFSLVRGKNEWRLTSVSQVSREYISLPFLQPTAGISRHLAFGRISKLLLRLVAGEEHTPALYTSVIEGFSYLAAAQSETDADPSRRGEAEAEAIECVLVLRILAHLGYLPQRQELLPFVADSLFSLELTAQAAKSRSLLIKVINESLGATGL
ncbi:MAG: recombination protein O N-terminal domain-containing protein [bacterium]|nr:recombination protein O N-terminal domain-containing protein [bacterium]